jgi:hypothetical protein
MGMTGPDYLHDRAPRRCSRESVTLPREHERQMNDQALLTRERHYYSREHERQMNLREMLAL